MGGGASSARGKAKAEPQKPPPLPPPSATLLDRPPVVVPVTQVADAKVVVVDPAQQADILDALETARCSSLRSLPRAVLCQLAHASAVEDLPAGDLLDCSDLGWCLVLSGEASVRLSAGSLPSDAGGPVELASLQRGDSVHWQVPHEGLTAMHLEIAVTGPLRLCRLRGDVDPDGAGPRPAPSTAPTAVGSGGGTSSSQSLASRERGLAEQLGKLWLSTSPPRTGIGDQRLTMLRAHFLAALWSPLLDSFQEHQKEIRHRQAEGYRKHDCFPLVGRQIVELRSHTKHLTDIWYGTARGGNFSAFYRWFIESMDILGVTAYSFATIPQEHSPDGWATSVDGSARAAALKGKGSSDANYVAAGGMAQRQGRSAIDNTVLRNLLMPLEARELLVGRRVRKAVCQFFAVRQICILRRLSHHLQLDLSGLASKGASNKEHAAARMVLLNITDGELTGFGMDPSSLCLRELRQRGRVLAGFGQLEASDQKSVWEAARRLVMPGDDASAGVIPRADAPDIFERFVAWSRDCPGEYFEKSKKRHIETKIAGMMARKIVVVKRSAMERFALARYFPLYWHRSQPLWGVFAEPVQVRRAGVAEASHVRANECPYAKSHGMALSGASQADAPEAHKRRRQSHLLTEMGWVKDPAANIGNWFLTDIEKILQEAWQLNPHGPSAMLLPGEMWVSVGQNPKVGSSIKETQHTQICEASAQSYPVMQLATSPRFSERLGAWVDLVDIAPLGEPPGEDQTGCFLRLTTPSPTAPALLQFLVGLRLALLLHFGGGQALDFLVLAMSDEKGGFAVLFAPLPQLLKLGEEKPDFASWANPFTGESTESVGLEEARVDVGKGVGHFLVSKPALRKQILESGEDFVRRVWCFNRVPGVRECMRAYLEEQQVF